MHRKTDMAGITARQKPGRFVRLDTAVHLTPRKPGPVVRVMNWIEKYGIEPYIKDTAIMESSPGDNRPENQESGESAPANGTDTIATDNHSEIQADSIDTPEAGTANAAHDSDRSQHAATAEFNNAMQTAIQEYENQYSQLLDRSHEAESLNSEVQRLAQSLANAEDQCDSLKAQTARQAQELRTRAEELNNSLQTIEDQRQHLAASNSKVGMLGSEVRALTDALESSAADAERLNQRVESLGSEVETLTLTLEKRTSEAHELSVVGDELRNDISRLTNSLQISEGEYQELDAHFRETTEKLNNALQTAAERRQQLSERGVQIESLENDVASVTAALEARTGEVDALTSRAGELQGEIERLSAALQESEDKRKRLEVHTARTEEELKTTKDALEFAQQTSAEQNQQLEARATRIEELTAAVRARSSEVTDLRARAEEFINKSDNLSGELTVIKAALHESQLQKKQLEIHAARSDELTASEAALKDEIEKLSLTLQASENQCRELEAHAMQAEKLGIQTTQMNAEIERLTEALEQADSQRVLLEKQVSETEALKASLDSRNSKIEVLSASVQDYEARCQTLEAQARQAQELGVQGSELQAEIERLTSALQEAESRRVQLEESAGQLDEMTATLEARTDKIEVLTTAVQDYETRCQTLEAQLREASETGSQAEILQQDVERLTASLLEAENDRQQLATLSNQENKELQGRIERLEATLHTTEQTRGDLERKLSELETQAGEAGKLHSQLRELGGELEGRNSELEKMTSLLEEQKGIEDKTRVRAEKLTSQVEWLNVALQTSGAQIKELEAKASQIDLLNAEISKLDAALCEANEKNQMLETGPERNTDELHEKIERLTAELNAAQTQLQNASENADKVNQLAAEVERLTTALSEARGNQQMIEGQFSQNTAAADEKLGELSAALQKSESHCRELENQVSNNAELNGEISKLREALEASEAQKQELEARMIASGPDGMNTPAGENGAEIEKKIEDLKNMDMLTGLYNRQYFMRTLDEVLIQKPDPATEKAVFYILMDNFMSIRENIGIVAGDQVLGEIADLLKEECSEHDIAARFGDFAFTMLVCAENADKLQVSGEAVRKAIESHMTQIDGHAVITTASIGICMLGKNTNSAQNILTRVDLACEVARSSGGNQIHTHSTVLDDKSDPDHENEWDDMIRSTIDEGRFYLAFQPIIRLGESTDQCYEVLLRIVDEEGNIILPGQFISIAEKIGLSGEIDRWVIESAFRKLAESSTANITLFMKMSGATLADTAIPAWIGEQLEKYNLDKNNIVFEIPEMVAVQNLKHALYFTKAISAMQCRIALEHYNATSQPQLLKHLPLNVLKIDGALISELSSDRNAQAKVQSIISLAREYKLLSVAERVDDASIMALLWSYGVDFAQGNFIQEAGKNLDYEFYDEIVQEEQVSAIHKE